MSTFSLKQFHTQVRRTGLAKQNRFEIEFPVPQLLQKRGIFQGRVVNLFCESTSLPPQSINIKQQRIYGPAYQRPFSSDYGGDGISMTFLLDQPMDIKAFFDAWLSIIVDPVQYYVHYQDDYVVPIKIKQLNEKDQVTYTAEIVDAFPRNYSMLEVNNASTNSVHKINVMFAYRKWNPIHRSINALSKYAVNP
jgi:hypothetical protein